MRAVREFRWFRPCFLLILLFEFTLLAVAGNKDCRRPALHGSFLQPALGDEWTIREWRKEFQFMQDAGVRQMLIQWTADSREKTTIFPSSLAGYKQSTRHDVVERALKTADASGAQVFLGLQVNDDWWTVYISDSAWLKNEAKIANTLGDDLWRKYKSHPSLAGWYLPFEVDNVESDSTQWDNLISFYRTVGNHLHQLTPGKPIIISPFYEAHDGMTASEWQTMWEYVLKKSPIDVLALQDGVGVAHASRAELPTWFAAVRDAVEHARPSTKFWVDTETFVHEYATMPIRSIVDDMCAVEPYVSNYVSFSFNHYLSPQQANPLYYREYMDYLAEGKVESEAPTTPANLNATAIDSTTIRLTWSASTDNVGVAGYKLFRDSDHVVTLYNSDTAYDDSGLDAGTTYSYQVRAFDAAGNQSPWSAESGATTPAPHLYPNNIALGRTYVATMPADSSYPDSGGVELTDGILASTSFADPAWQGRATTKAYTFTVDLGGSQVIREVRSDWLQDLQSGILLPRKITYSVSDDNKEFFPIGEVRKPMAVSGTEDWWYTLTDLASVSGRFVQVRVAPGSNAEWTFIDEIEVRQ